MKPIICLFITLAIFASAIRAQTPTMHVKLKDGTSHDFALTDVRKITFGPSGQITATREIAGLVKTFALFQNYPNPFNPTTTIRYEIPRGGEVRTNIYTVTGQFVRELSQVHQQAGVYAVTWDGRNSDGQTVASGIYFYRVAFERSVLTQKMIFLK